jgi:hypothetical protein
VFRSPYKRFKLKDKNKLRVNLKHLVLVCLIASDASSVAAKKLISKQLVSNQPTYRVVIVS